jgi:hypothetical protein
MKIRIIIWKSNEFRPNLVWFVTPVSASSTNNDYQVPTQMGPTLVSNLCFFGIDLYYNPVDYFQYFFFLSNSTHLTGKSAASGTTNNRLFCIAQCPIQTFAVPTA